MEAYIVGGYRSAVGRAQKGALRFFRPDDLAALVIRHLLKDFPQLDKDLIDDVIVGNATPEAEQGLNFARLISLLSLDTDKVAGMTVNRYCSSGIETIGIATAKIKAGMADCIIAGGVESMSLVPMGGWKVIPNYTVSVANPDWYWNMGLTAEEVAREFKISREDQDAFAFHSHEKAVKAIQKGKFKSQIVPVYVCENYVDDNMKRQQREYLFDTDESPRQDTTIEKLAKLKPVFASGGVITAGNSSPTNDGASFVLVVSEKLLKELDLKPIARLVSYSVAGVAPRIMGMGPVEAVPKALKQAGLTLNSIDLIEFNEAFASQALAVSRQLDFNPEIVNVNGGGIALGHPLGCTGAKLSVQLFNEMQERKSKYGLVTMCVGTGQGAAGIYENLM